MKKLALLICVFSISTLGASFAQTSEEKTLPPMSELPKEGDEKTFYELDKEYAYQIFDFKGELLSEGTAKHIDITALKPGVYFIAYNGKKVRYVKPGMPGM